MTARRVAGIILLSLSLFSVVQTIQEVWQSYNSEWTESPIRDNEFRFAGRTISIEKPPYSSSSNDQRVQQERIRIDGMEVGAATGLRMSRWRLPSGIRSPHWLTVMAFVDRARGDSSLWIARRLQAADSVPQRFEIITIDATGEYRVQMHTQDELRRDYRLNAVTGLVGESPFPEFWLSIVNFAMVPWLLLIFPIGTGVLGVALLRSSRAQKDEQ